MGIKGALRGLLGRTGNDTSEFDCFDERLRKKYLEECHTIWKKYVPDNGQAGSLQGELLREVEKLRYEAMNNGNVNWDDDYARFCDFVADSICSMQAVPKKQADEVRSAMSRIKQCGEYSNRFYNGDIPDGDVEVDMIACVDIGIYDSVEAVIGFISLNAGRPIPYEHNPEILR